MINNVFIEQACLIFNEQWHILAIKRSDNDDSRPGLRDIPGGGCHQEDIDGLEGDVVMENIHKEIKEETWLAVSDVSLLYLYSKKPEQKEENKPEEKQQQSKPHLTLFMMYLAMYEGGDVVLSDEHAAYERISPVDFLERDSGWMGYEVEKAIRQLQDDEE